MLGQYGDYPSPERSPIGAFFEYPKKDLCLDATCYLTPDIKKETHNTFTSDYPTENAAQPLLFVAC